MDTYSKKEFSRGDSSVTARAWPALRLETDIYSACLVGKMPRPRREEANRANSKTPSDELPGAETPTMKGNSR